MIAIMTGVLTKFVQQLTVISLSFFSRRMRMVPLEGPSGLIASIIVGINMFSGYETLEDSTV